MLSFKLVYSDRYALPIGRHVFPAEKYQGVRDMLLSQGDAEPGDFLEPIPATEADTLLVHSHLYVNKLMEGALTAREELQMEIPYSQEVVDSFLWHTGGSILASECALADGVALNLGGGFHHAFPDHGEGFCMIHDVAVAIRKLQHAGRIQRAMVIDCDVHHGNGTASIFCKPSSFGPEPERQPVDWGGLPGVSIRIGHSADVFALSLHQENNYPLWKPPSSLDVNLPDGTDDHAYLECLRRALEMAFQRLAPDLICYIAGADPFVHDQLGGLSLTIQGLKERDQLVFRAARERRTPVMVAYAGGYARELRDTVTIHRNTILAARDSFE